MKQKVIIEIEDGKVSGVHTDAEVEVLVVNFDEIDHKYDGLEECDFVVPIETMNNLPQPVKEALHYVNGEAHDELHCGTDEAN